MAIQIRRGNAADLVPANLSQGEPFVCLDTQVVGIKGNSAPIYMATGDSSGNALNALKLGGVLAASFPQISSGTWTPTLYGGTTAGSPTYVAQSGTYHKNGTHVMLNGLIQISAKGGIAGILMIGGLPLWLATVGRMGILEGTNGFNLSTGTLYGGTARANLIIIEKVTVNGIANIDASEIYDGALIKFAAEGFTD